MGQEHPPEVEITLRINSPTHPKTHKQNSHKVFTPSSIPIGKEPVFKQNTVRCGR